MGKIYGFAVRNAKEILRDPLSYIFCLGFPLIMLLLMAIINRSIPVGTGPTQFQMGQLGPAMVVFGFCFDMLFTAQLLAKDRCSAFLGRLYAAPMKAGAFLAGYLLPVLILALAQGLLTSLTAWVIGLWMDEPITLGGMLLALIVMLPVIFMFVSLGLLFGGLFSDKAAPGFSSVIITAAGLLGGMWMDVEVIGGTIERIAQCLPFYPAVQAARLTAGGGSGTEIWTNLLIPVGYGLIFFVLAAVIFRRNMTRDLR